MILAGFLYVGGALGMEAVASYLNYEIGERGLYFAVLTTIEESMEMFGLLVFLYALLYYSNSELGRMSLSFGNTLDHQLSGGSEKPVTAPDRLPVENKTASKTVHKRPSAK